MKKPNDLFCEIQKMIGNGKKKGGIYANTDFNNSKILCLKSKNKIRYLTEKINSFSYLYLSRKVKFLALFFFSKTIIFYTRACLSI